MAKLIATVSEKGLLLAAVKMTALMVLITLMNSAGGKASDLFGELTGIAVLLTMLPYFYSCVDLIRFEGINIRNCQPDLFGTGLRVLLHRADGRKLLRTGRHLYR
jgi:amino acid permease